jgi:hypothetical protein
MIVNRMIGSKVMPGDNSDPMMMMLEPLISSMNQEQLASIAGTLNSQQQLQFWEILQTFQKRKAAQATNGVVKEN